MKHVTMKHVKRILTMLLALTLLLAAFTACGEKAPEPRSASDIGKEVVAQLETDLTETEMRTAIDGYAHSLSEALAEGSATASFVDEKDGSVALVVQPNGTDNTQELMKFGSVKEAFAYFVYTGQIDKDGTLINPPVVQTVPAKDAAENAAASEAAESSSDSETAQDVTTDIPMDAETEAAADEAAASASMAMESAVVPFADSAVPAA